MRLTTIIYSLLLLPCLAFAQHPVTFFTKNEAAEVKKDLGKYPLLQQSFTEMQRSVDKWLDKEIDVPMPKDPAGGYTHDKHKANYMLIFNSGVLYQLTGNAAYARFAKALLLKYAALNPGLKDHPQARGSSPGHLFHQALNDANWLVYAGMGYDCIYNTLSATEREKIATGAFAPEVALFVKDGVPDGVDLIHNHGVWSCVAVGIAGLATDNDEYVQQALYGIEKNGKGGFIAQMNQLFAPDGYYTEGPYYTRYALLPFFIFANALNNAKPQLKIYEQRGQLLQKALHACLQQTNTNGEFFPLNDALKGMDVTTNDMVIAVDMAWEAYGRDKGLLAVAQQQNRVLLNGGGAAIAKELAGNKEQLSYPYKTVQYTDGAKGDEGGISLLRTGEDKSLTTLVYKYTAQGLSHGHFDKLSFCLYDKGNEVFRDYGSVRFVNVEQKDGGRYLPENKAYAMQTIAHNTLVVDEKSHFNGKTKEGEKYHPEQLFSSISNPAVQVVSVKDVHAYPDVQMHRTMYMLQPDAKQGPVIIDIFRTTATGKHQYDLPFQYKGQLISTSFKYNAFTTALQTMGKKNGYQFLWKEAEATTIGTPAQFTFLEGTTYYSVSSLVDDSTQIFFTRTGANDPSFNVRREPAYMLRRQGNAPTFVNVIEVHGKFDPVSEISTATASAVQDIELLRNDDDYTVVKVKIKNELLWIAQCNKNFDAKAAHTLKVNGISLEWTGPYKVITPQVH